MKISPSNIFQKILLLEKYYQNCQACFGRSECEWVKSSSRRKPNASAAEAIKTSAGKAVVEGVEIDVVVAATVAATAVTSAKKHQQYLQQQKQ